jgi:hypothetical protein
VQATVPHGVGFFGNWAPNPSVDVQLFDFAILGIPPFHPLFYHPSHSGSSLFRPFLLTLLIIFSGDTNVRVDDAVDSGVGGAFNGNSLVQNLWIEHTKCGMWLGIPLFIYMLVSDLTIRKINILFRWTFQRTSHYWIDHSRYLCGWNQLAPGHFECSCRANNIANIR